MEEAMIGFFDREKTICSWKVPVENKTKKYSKYVMQDFCMLLLRTCENTLTGSSFSADFHVINKTKSLNTSLRKTFREKPSIGVFMNLLWLFIYCILSFFGHAADSKHI